MYLDPGSWGLVLQFAIGFIVSIPILVGIYWKKVRTMFSRSKNAKGK